ncbi:hypothetical protein Mapa_004015 [Marchantia paleacea]|nr:hypothetical protein Mapa_004015 [Marchantia paleacea]
MESDSRSDKGCDEKASSSEPAEPTSGSMGSSLPDDLLLNVLRKLPLESVMRFRCVCKEWNDLFMSSEFSHLFCHKPGKLVPLYLVDRSLSLYDSSNRCWVQRDLKCGPDQVSFIEDQGYELVASGGGLLCFLAKAPLDSNSWEELIISNPLTRQYHRLPTTFEHGSRFLKFPNVANMLCGIDVDLETGYYTLVFLDPRSTDDEGETYIYDSKLRSWRIGSKLPSSIRRLDRFAEPYTLYSGYKSQCVTREGKFHWLVSQTEGPTLDLVYIYDVKLDIWSYVFCGGPNERTTFVRCMEHKGEVLVVGKHGPRHVKQPFCYFEIVDTGSLNSDSMDGRRLYLREKALPMDLVVDVLAPLQVQGTKEARISWCVGARDEVIYLLEAQSFECALDAISTGPRRRAFRFSSPMLRYAGVDNSWTWLSNWKILKDGCVSLRPYASHGVWTFQPSLVSPGSIESTIKHPYKSNDEELTS